MNELDFEKTTNEEPEIDFEPFYNQHFIEVDEQNRIVKGWSDAFAPATENSIVINEQGGYQFRLFLNGEENPSLYTWDMVPLYKWDGEQVVARGEDEIEADRAAIPKPPVVPGDHERLELLENAMLETLTMLSEV